MHRSRMICLFAAGLCATTSTLHAALSHTSQSGFIPMRDGKSLACDIYLPAGGNGPWACILIQTPYNKDVYDTCYQYDYPEPFLHNANYAFAYVDWRGRFGSQSAAYTGSPTLGQDGYDAVEWIAAQPWCTGAVGTWGASASGLVQLQTAAEHPPHLRACVPITYYFRQKYELFYPGGVYARNRNNYIYGLFGGTPVWGHPLYDAWWDYCENNLTDYGRLDVPMLHISGWYDHETAQTIEEMESIQRLGGPSAVGHQKIMIGPWTHGNVAKAQQGQLQYPAAELVSSQAAVEFFDFYLRGVANGYPSQPTIRYFRMNEDRWFGIEQWPPASTPFVFHLHSDASLRPETPTQSPAWLEYLADPADPVPTLFGAIVSEGAASRGPGDLRPVEERSDVLEFTTAPVLSPLTIEGQVEARVWLSCQTPSARDTDLAVRLAEVYPDGRSMLLVDGIHRASLRGGFAAPAWLETGVPVEVSVKLPPLSVTIPPGHSLRVLVEPSNYDRFEINPQDGSFFPDQTETVPTAATIRIWMDRDHPSRVILPTAASLVRADFDGDGDVDSADLDRLVTAARGPGILIGEPTPFDLDHDGDVDQVDFAVVQRCISGEGTRAVPGCDSLVP